MISSSSSTCTRNTTTTTTTTIAGRLKIPLGSWDSHMHVIDPKLHPLSSNAHYIPTAHTLSEALEFESSLGLQKLVFVQPSIYGYDNSCLLDALARLGPRRGRGVITIDPNNTRTEALEEWHRLGVRGVRLNFRSVNKKPSPQELIETLKKHAAIVRPWNWVIQLYVSLDIVPILANIVPELGVKVCLDHFGSPAIPTYNHNHNGEEASFDPYMVPLFSDLVQFLKLPNTYVKISAPYRFDTDPFLKSTTAITKELLRLAKDRLVFATDWPHTRFEGVDTLPFTQICLQLCEHEAGLAEKLFRQNAEDLWDVQETSSI